MRWRVRPACVVGAGRGAGREVCGVAPGFAVAAAAALLSVLPSSRAIEPARNTPCEPVESTSSICCSSGSAWALTTLGSCAHGWERARRWVRQQGRAPILTLYCWLRLPRRTAQAQHSPPLPPPHPPLKPWVTRPIAVWEDAQVRLMDGARFQATGVRAGGAFYWLVTGRGSEGRHRRWQQPQGSGGLPPPCALVCNPGEAYTSVNAAGHGRRPAVGKHTRQAARWQGGPSGTSPQKEQGQENGRRWQEEDLVVYKCGKKEMLGPGLTGGRRGPRKASVSGAQGGWRDGGNGLGDSR